MNTEYFDEYEDFFDFSSEFEALEKEDNLTRKLPANKNVNYEVIRIEKEGQTEIHEEEEGEWEDEQCNKNGAETKTGKRYRLYKFIYQFF